MKTFEIYSVHANCQIIQRATVERMNLWCEIFRKTCFLPFKFIASEQALAAVLFLLRGRAGRVGPS